MRVGAEKATRVGCTPKGLIMISKKAQIKLGLLAQAI